MAGGARRGSAKSAGILSRLRRTPGTPQQGLANRQCSRPDRSYRSSAGRPTSSPRSWAVATSLPSSGLLCRAVTLPAGTRILCYMRHITECRWRSRCCTKRRSDERQIAFPSGTTSTSLDIIAGSQKFCRLLGDYDERVGVGRLSARPAPKSAVDAPALDTAAKSKRAAA